MKTRVCTKCGDELELTTKNFYARKGGFKTICKECTRKRIKEYVSNNKEKVKETHKISCKKYRVNNKEKIAEQSKLYNIKNKDRRKEYNSNNKEHIAETVKQYREANKEKILELLKQYRKDNKETLSQKNKQWQTYNKECYIAYQKEYRNKNQCVIKVQLKEYYNNNKGKFIIYGERRRTRKLQLESTLTTKQWEQIKLEFSNCCAYCGKEVPLAQEHFLALSRNGEYTINNIIPSCKSCNSSKGTKLFSLWYPKYQYYSKRREKFILKYLHYNKQNIQQLSIL